MSVPADFQLLSPLVPGSSHERCRACVIIPARNEETSIASALDAMARQKSLLNHPLPSESFEILLLLNNCTDKTAEIAYAWQAAHPQISLNIVEKTIPKPQAHVGTSRRLLMDTAWQRLARAIQPSAILSTDSDSIVADNWIASNLRAIERGADAVGGQILLKEGELETLPPGAREAYLEDRRYQYLVSQLLSILDPLPEDPAPRHLEHFGASLACTPWAYAQAGGMPAITPLEDVAFVNALLKVGARLRHDPEVIVYTSARFDGRAEIGLSQQLRSWQALSEEGKDHLVSSAEWHVFRSSVLHALRTAVDPADSPILLNLRFRPSIPNKSDFRPQCPLLQQLGVVECDRLIEEAFRGKRHASILSVNRDLEVAIDMLLKGRGSAHPATLGTNT